MKISELAHSAGVQIDTVRYYERRGLLGKPPRTSGGYRDFPEAAVKVVRFIKRAQSLGFTLREIRDLLTLRGSDVTCDAVRSAVESKLTDIKRKEKDLHAMRRTLQQLIGGCPGDRPVSECPILESWDDL